MNDHDSGKVAGVLHSPELPAGGVAGISLADHLCACSIREKAAQKVFLRLGEFGLQQNEGRIIGVPGLRGAARGRGDFWARTVGEFEYAARRVAAGCWSCWHRSRQGTGASPALITIPIRRLKLPMTQRDNPWRAYLTIIEGCDKACSYCVVPYTRRPNIEASSAIRFCAKCGNLRSSDIPKCSSWGRRSIPTKIRRRARCCHSELLLAVADAPGIRRVRFTTSHPRDTLRTLWMPLMHSRSCAITFICPYNRDRRESCRRCRRRKV